MMPVAALLLSLLAVTTPSSSIPQRDECRVFMSYSSEGRRETEFCISGADARRLPAWDPEKEEPPLPVSRALEIGRAHAKSMRPKWDDAAIVRIEMAPLHIGADGPPWKWYYNLNISSSQYPESWYGGNFHLVIFMDGTILEGRPATLDR